MEISGLITKCEEKYAYALTEKGSVFIPSAAARIDKGVTLTDLRTVFRNNEPVLLRVEKQAQKKNGCRYIATSVRKTAPSQVLSDEVHGPVEVTVTSSEETYAFGVNEIYGTIFLPGDAFDPNVVKNVRRYCKERDILIVTFKEQIELKKCHWVAISAVKQFKPFIGEDLGILETQGSSSSRNVAENRPKPPQAPGRLEVFYGAVTLVEPCEVTVATERHPEPVLCHMLAYTGGYKDNNYNATTLHDLVQLNDYVMYSAVKQHGHWRALEWKLIDSEEKARITVPRPTSDSAVQTVPDLAFCLLKRVLHGNDALQVKYAGLLPKLPPSALPDDYIVTKNDSKFNSRGI